MVNRWISSSGALTRAIKASMCASSSAVKVRPCAEAADTIRAASSYKATRSLFTDSRIIVHRDPCMAHDVPPAPSLTTCLLSYPPCASVLEAAPFA